MGGGGDTVTVADYAPADSFEVRRASTYRMVVDLATPDRFLSVLAPGQSEHPGHRHFADGMGPWLAGRARILPNSRFLIEEHGGERLVLQPVR